MKANTKLMYKKHPTNITIEGHSLCVQYTFHPFIRECLNSIFWNHRAFPNSCGVNILCARQRLFCKRHIQTPETVWINCIIPLFCSVLEPHGQWWHFNRDTVHYSAAPTLCLVCCALVWGVLLWVQSKLAHNTQKLNHFKITIQCFFMYKVVDLTESLDRVHSLLFYILFLFDWYCLSISRPSCHGCNQSVGGTGGCGSVRGW